MLADDEESQSPGDAHQETLEAEVAIGHPQRAFLDQVEDGIDQRPLLGMTVFSVGSGSGSPAALRYSTTVRRPSS